MKIVVIGAGSSGIAAALQAAWNGAAVVLLEKNAFAGRKLLVTGSGRCNITNAAVAAHKYTCADPHWMQTLLSCFGVGELLAMLAEVGIPLVKTDDGWYYPLSNSAQAVVDALTSALEQAGVVLRTASRVTSILPGQNGLKVTSVTDGEEKVEEFERVIIAAGGTAYPALGSSGELFPALERLGHRLLPKRPALAPVLVDLQDLKALQGVRMDAAVELWDGKERLAGAIGNLIFTEWGLNGPAVMDVSHHISARPAARLHLSLNVLQPVESEFNALLSRKRGSAMPVRVFLEAFYLPKVASYFLRAAHILADRRLNETGGNEMKRLTGLLQDTRRDVKGVRGFEYCQVSAGGVPVTEVHPHTLESKFVKGLYLSGETLDVVGPCGGYNLQFAFSSGALAGRAAAGVAKKSS